MPGGIAGKDGEGGIGGKSGGHFQAKNEQYELVRGNLWMCGIEAIINFFACCPSEREASDLSSNWPE